MKAYIYYQMKDSAFGGANQFLKALKVFLVSQNVYAESIEEADIVLFNSMIPYEEIFEAKYKYPEKIFVHRVDGPCKLYNNMSDKRDDMVYRLNNIVADATVFQSEYSREKSLEMGCPRGKYETTITNACDKGIFYSNDNKESFVGRKLKLIATSFSDNWKKGFKTYQWIDENLDFNRYEMTFIGKAPCTFNNIKHLSPMDSKSLADMLRRSDIYITASENDPCSNSLIEAMACGLPVLALNSGGHPELVGKRGEVFNKVIEIPSLLDKIEENYTVYRNSERYADMENVGEQYVEFLQMLEEKKQQGELKVKKITKWDVWKSKIDKKIKKRL